MKKASTFFLAEAEVDIIFIQYYTYAHALWYITNATAPHRLATREIQPYFQDIVEEQHLLESSKHGIISLIPHPFQQNIHTFILKYAPERRLEELSSMVRILFICMLVTKHMHSNKICIFVCCLHLLVYWYQHCSIYVHVPFHIYSCGNYASQKKYPRLIQRIQMAICHPRFDQEVTVQENHLLRLLFPFITNWPSMHTHLCWHYWQVRSILSDHSWVRFPSNRHNT